MPETPATNGPTAGSSIPAKPRSGKGAAIAAIVIVLVVAVPTVLYVYPGYLKPSSSAPLDEGGFTMGQVVTFQYNGTHTFLCVPGMSVMFPGNATAAAAAGTTACEVGNASQTAVSGQVPEWVLVPAFAGLSVFGVAALGASARGFPTQNSTTVPTDCGAGGSPTACVDHPTYLYSPFFTAVEDQIGATTGYAGLPLGVLPTPAHDHVINTSAVYPNVEWGTIAVLVLDPNILPDRATGLCTLSVPSNLSNPTGHCLTSLGALNNATRTCSSSVTHFNAAVSNPIWLTLNALTSSTVCAQVVVPGDITLTQVDTDLNSNLYIPFSVSPGAPSSFPS